MIYVSIIIFVKLISLFLLYKNPSPKYILYTYIYKFHKELINFVYLCVILKCIMQR